MQTLTQPTFDTMRFIPPTLEEVKARAAEIELPDHEAEKFHLYFESNGWMVGRTKMSRWSAALAGWRLRWKERQPNGHHAPQTLSGAQIVLFSKELERVQVRMDETKYTASLSGWSPKLKEDYKKYRARKTELKKMLGITL